MAGSQRAGAEQRNPREAPKGKREGVRIWLLGTFWVSVGSRIIEENEWRLKKAGSLIKLLALAPHHRLHREQVMNLLWPELETEAATNNLHRTLHFARRVLEPSLTTPSHCLHLQGEQLVLSPGEPLWVDVEAFEDAAATARHSREPGAYRAAIELYAGELLPEDRYEGWAQERREGLRRLYLALLVELAELHEVSEEYGLAIEALQKAVTNEPTHEEAHIGLMRLYALDGQRHQALRQYEQLREALRKELGSEPNATSRGHYTEIVAERFPVTHPSPVGGPPAEPPNARRHNLPHTRTSFIGRKQQMLEVKRLLSMTGLLTLTGSGGCGKTRLALEVAKDLLGAYSDGVWLVELAGLSEETLVPNAVAAALGVREQPGRPLSDTLVDFLRSKRMLLVLDNCEHLIYACARLVDTLLGSCEHLRVLATSREALGVPGEASWLVPSLTVPDAEHLPALQSLTQYEAVRLFVERTRSRLPGFVLTPENAQAVIKVCGKLDGIPLAIELATARMTVLAVEQVAERLEDSLKLLTAGSRTADPRHQTLRATLEWSYELLSEPERKLFGRLSVFAGSWTLEAAEAVGAGGGIEGGDVLDLLSRLVDKSLVVAEAGAEGALRYRMLEPVRQYGQERLEADGEAERARERHAEHYLALAEEAEPELRRAQQEAWLERLESEHGNLRAALRWLLEKREAEPALRLVGALGEFWRTRGYLREGQGWLEAALAIEGGDTLPERLKALNYAGWMAWNRLDFERTTAASQELLALSRELGDEANVAAALHHLGMVAIYDQMKAEKARALFEESLRIRREIGDEVGVSYSLQRLGLISVVQRDFGQARVLYEQCIALSRKTGNEMSNLNALWLGGLAYLGLDDHEEVERVCEEGIGLAQRIGSSRLTALLLYVMAASIAQRGRPVRAGRLWGAAESFLDSVGLGLGPAHRYHYGPYIAAAREQLDEDAWEAAWAEGKAMKLEEAVEYALSEEELAPSIAPASKQPPASKPMEQLTRREQEIAVLVTRGLTNRRIASELGISEHTVIAHVRKILKKLGFHSRAQIATWVTEGQTLP